jgi:signal transduction histidine kinase/DNA-binding response OmpR family regulator/CHASE3 domain sensor protein
MPTNSVIRQLQLVFSISTILLVVSLVASFYSIQRLIANSKLVNHTNEILIEAENVISLVKDAETGQRGYLVTLDPSFLQSYTGTREKLATNLNRLRDLTVDNPTQQRNLDEAETLYGAKFDQLQRTLDLTRRNSDFRDDSTARNREMVRGKQVMDDLRRVVNRIKLEESGLLETRLAQQQRYITYTPFLLLVAALLSIAITTFAYLRIKRDLDERLAQQEREQETYRETARRITVLEGLTQQIADGTYSVRSTDDGDDDLGRIAQALNRMVESLERTFTDLQDQNWLQAGAVQVRDAIRGEKDTRQLGTRLVEALATYIGAPLGTAYLIDSELQYPLAGTFAARQPPAQVRPGEGLLGLAIEQKKTLVIDDVPADYGRIASSLGEARPTTLVILPLLYGADCVGVVELGLLRKPTSLELAFLEGNREPLAIGVNAALDFVRLQNLLEETQAQSEELQAQHEELENLNAELEMQAQKLQASEEELRVQQEELQQTNTELEERGLLLEERNTEIQQKADELELATRYKSEFLANMSHELRTPLNSVLLLSRLLAENREQNLNDDQVEYARVIQSSGNGLLALIDEILDLSKIEAGQMKLEYEAVPVGEVADELRALFGVVAQEKNLDFAVTVEPEVPAVLQTDRQRLGQILKNLLSNALKFTASGRVSLTVRPNPTRADQLSFVVRDTGIGIAPEKQPLVFEAFQQADGSTKRKYGGTGLGLSISRELAKLLGGDLTLWSRLGEGSEFTLHLPLTSTPPVPSQAEPVTRPVISVPPAPTAASGPAGTYLSAVIPKALADDRADLSTGDKVILIVEDDPGFAQALLDYARQQGYKGIVAVRGDEGLALAQRYRPTGILLDIQLPVLSGWEVMDALKADPQTRPIPVHIMSSHRLRNESLLKGAVDFVDKPVAFEQLQEVFTKIEDVLSRHPKKVLIVEDNPKHAQALAYFLESFRITSELKSNVDEGIDALQRREVDCVILDMGVPDSTAYATLEAVKKNPGLENLPIIIFTGKSLSMAEELKIKKYADSIIIKTAHSYQRMLDEVSLFLHLVQETKSATGTAATGTGRLGALNQVLRGKTVLVVDDDVRNIFSLSKALEQYQMNVVTALDGKEALQKLAETPQVDVVLLDMMMPQMDGYETARTIRAQRKWKNLPVIAVTAKAMTGDRDKCIEAGASDYITKPVDVDQLISLLRVWLYDRS